MDETQSSKKNTGMIVVGIIAVLAILGAGYLLVQNNKTAQQNEELAQQAAMAQKEADMKAAEMEKNQEMAKDFLTAAYGQYVKTAEEVTALVQGQQAEIDAANSQVEGLAVVEQCRQLMSVGPKNADTWYTSDYSENFQQDICKYMRDIQRDLDAATKAGDEDAVKALEQAQEIAQPYYDNFSQTCSSVYDMSTCAFITETQ